MPDLPCCFKRIFSGFKSQWMILFRDSTSKHWSIECANLRTSWRLNPLIFRKLKNHVKNHNESLPGIDSSWSARTSSSRAAQRSCIRDCGSWSSRACAPDSCCCLCPIITMGLIGIKILTITCFLSASKMRISSCACLWKRFSLRTIFKATCCCVLWSNALITWPKLPLP